MSDQNNDWEREIITRLAESSLKEQRRARRWGIFFKLFAVAYLTTLLVLYSNPEITNTAALSGKHTALINIKGVISADDDASADNVITSLRNAFEDEKTAGVILRINSPGGSPVQSGYIYDEIVRLREKYEDIPVYAVITDICASGGYYIASAADKIYADKASIVGSIGVRMDNFGFVDAMKKVGVERRTLTAGKSKALLDPFLPINEDSKEHLQGMLNDIHKQFITAVKNGRGDRLKTDVEGLFEGLIWTGQQGVEVGLVDELASSSKVARDVIGEEDIVEYAVTEDILEKLANRVGASVASMLHTRLVTPNLE